MERIIKVLLMGVALVALILICGCRSKKKFVERKAFTVERVSSLKVNEITEKGVSASIDTESATQTITTNNDESVNVETADPGKDVSLTKEINGSKTTWTASNANSLSIFENDNQTLGVDTTSFKMSIIDRYINEKQTEAESKNKGEYKARATNTDIESTSTFVSIGIGLAVLLGVGLIIYFLYRSLRKA